MSDFDALDEIYEISKRVGGEPCHPKQAKARQIWAARHHVVSRSSLERQRMGLAKRTPAPITLAKINLPDIPAD